MPVDIHKEKLLTLAEAAHSLPGHVAPSTLWRWHKKGIRGIRLESVLIGGKRLVSVESLTRFAEALTAASEPTSTVLDPTAAPTDRDESTQRKLKDAGLLK